MTDRSLATKIRDWWNQPTAARNQYTRYYGVGDPRHLPSLPEQLQAGVFRPIFSGSGWRMHKELTAIKSCCTILANALARCPWIVARAPVGTYRLADWEPVRGHPLNRVLMTGAPGFSYFDARRFMLMQRFRHGDGWFWVRGRGPNGMPMRLQPVTVTTSGTYPDVQRRIQLPGVSGRGQLVPNSDLVGVHDTSWDGVESLSPIEAYAWESAVLMSEAQRLFVKKMGGPLANRFAEMSADLAGLPDPVKYRADVQADMNSLSGVDDADKIKVLDPGIKLSDQPSWSANELQLIEFLRLSIEDICRLYHVHPRRIYQFDAKNSTAQPVLREDAEGFVRDSIAGPAAELSANLTMGFLSIDERLDGLSIVVDADVLAVSSLFDRAQTAERLGSRGGLITINEARRIVGYGPIEGGDRIYQPKGSPEVPDNDGAPFTGGAEEETDES